MARRIVGFGVLLLVAGSLMPTAGAAPGVTRTTIKIGLHAPLTGASPLPSDSIEKGKDLYFRWQEKNGGDIRGRTVNVILRNDQYNPSTAVSVCKQMVEQDHVFMLVGISGADQVTACARYAASVGVPYVSPGMATRYLKQLPTYFATTMTWGGQGRLMGRYLIDRLNARDRKNGSVTFDSPTFDEARAGFLRGMDAPGVQVDYDRKVATGAGSTEARAVVEEMKLAGIQNAFISTTPVWFLQLLQQANTQGFDPSWVGIDQGIAKDTVADVGCRGGGSFDGARFFSPYPAVAESDRFDPAFRNASRHFYPSKTPDDFMWQLWALDKTVAKMLALPGADLTRTRFVNRVERADRIATGIAPTLHYTPSDHFGANSTHVLKADCSDRRWHTVATFKQRF
ncbi:MAG: branched-chain amino acid transport system substrate-binding protein [Actinomycetota bacterium]|jgi:ABC-type branched-subunit amino acid transport system substrate-binding protein|nr:branched-chain amino acid transport system substrate-binding protein [Actinomycetota bacterium]